MTDATAKDLEQDAALRKLRQDVQEKLAAFDTESPRNTHAERTRWLHLNALLVAMNERISAIEDTLINEGRMRGKGIVEGL